VMIDEKRRESWSFHAESDRLKVIQIFGVAIGGLGWELRSRDTIIVNCLLSREMYVTLFFDAPSLDLPLGRSIILIY